MATNNMPGGVHELQRDGTLRTTREGTADMTARRKRECAEAARVLGTVPIHLDHPRRHHWDEAGQRDVELRYGCARPAASEHALTCRRPPGRRQPRTRRQSVISRLPNTVRLMTPGGRSPRGQPVTVSRTASQTTGGKVR